MNWNSRIKHLDPEKSPSSEDLDILQAAEQARQVFDKNLIIKFAPAIRELEELGYPGIADPKLTIATKMVMGETLKHDAAVQYTLSRSDTTLKLPEKYNGLGYQNLISMVFDLMRFRDDWMHEGKAKQIKKTSGLVIEPLHIVLIEEPEAHLHAQVQQVFIRKEYIEKKVAEMMAQDTGDVGWNDDDQYKSLILEHHMAASRFGFSELYMPLNDSKKFDTSLRDGSILELSILSKIVSPLVKAYKIGNDFEVAKIVRKNSPLLSKDAFVEEFKDQTELLKNAEEAVETLMQLWNDEKNLTCLEVLESIQNTGLFDVGSRIDELLTEYSQDEDEKITALRTALSVPFYEVERYALYVSDNTRFATHQGVKGLEFPRVMVILDDAQAKGFLFSYEKLFGVKAQSDTDIKNERDGKDTGITRTARLFYVACTRAENSLAVVAYTENEELVKATALSNGWFLENEIYII